MIFYMGGNFKRNFLMARIKRIREHYIYTNYKLRGKKRTTNAPSFRPIRRRSVFTPIEIIQFKNSIPEVLDIENIAIEPSQDEIANLLKFAYCTKFIPATFHQNAKITRRNALYIYIYMIFFFPFLFSIPSEARQS